MNAYERQEMRERHQEIVTGNPHDWRYCSCGAREFPCDAIKVLNATECCPKCGEKL